MYFVTIMGILCNFAVLEGGDGSGTSTQLGLLEQKIADNKSNTLDFYSTYEPTGSVIGSLIRSVLKNDVSLQAETLAHLFAADRNEHLYAPCGIIERCQRGQLVVCDRYILSSLVYQGIECGINLPRILNLNFPLPELLIFFKIDPIHAMHRINNRPAKEIFEHLEFQEKVQQQYHLLIEEYRNSGVRVQIIDASQSVDNVAEEVWSAVSKMPIFKEAIGNR
jgi:dTMP kinase